MKLKIEQKGYDIRSKTRTYQDFRLLNSWVLLLNYSCFVFGVILIAIGLDKKIGFWIIVAPMIVNLFLFIIFGIGRVGRKELSVKHLLYLAIAYAIIIIAIALGMYNIQIPKIPSGTVW